MRSTTSWIILIIIVLIILGGGWWLWNSNQATTTNTTVTTGTPTGQTTTVNNAGGTDYTPGNTNTDAPGSLDGSVSAGATVGTPTTVTVTYNGSSFSPSTVTIHTGDTVHFVSTSGGMWVASDVHPSHTKYDGTSRSEHCAAGYTGATPFDQCASGSSYSFTFTKAGTFVYHNHVNAGATGTVIVQ